MIKAWAAGASRSERRDTNPKSPQYKPIFDVRNAQPDGTEITLALQSRTATIRWDCTWYTVSWRTRLAPGGSNRRFYVTKGNIWRLSASLALEMMEEFERVGGLDEKYFDQRVQNFKVAILGDATEAKRSALLEDIMMPGESWGEDPFIVVLNDPHPDWRKILIVDRETGQATFRSTTKNKEYNFRKKLRPKSVWYLDNTMQDTNVQQARVFLEQLQNIVPTLK